MISELEERLRRLSIVGTPEVLVAGNLEQGYSVDTGRKGSGLGGGGSSGGGDGACCVDTACLITTAQGCADVGGYFLGIGSDCDPNPCGGGGGPTGACCHGAVCDIETEASCIGSGGTYMGDDTSCLDLTCACSCGFGAFDGSGRRFLRYHREISATSSLHEVNNCDPPNDSDVTVDAAGSATFEQHYASDCSIVTDTDTSSSSHTVTFNGSVTSSCSLSDMSCFCNVNIPEHNLCVSWIAGFVDCNHCFSGGCGSDNTVTTDTTRTRTVIFCVHCSEGGCTACVGCHDTCDVTGSYIVTETLSDECIPV